MKSKKTNLLLFMVFFGIVLASTALFKLKTQQLFPAGENNDSIDKLIVKTSINDKTILITYGSDALTAIKTRAGIIVIDAGISTGLTSRYRKIIEKEFPGCDFKYVINTHYHPDHYGGANVFGEAKIVGHKNGLNEISEQWKDTAKIKKNISNIVADYEQTLEKCEINSADWNEAFTQKTRYYSALEDVINQIRVQPPDITFADSLTMEVDKMTVEMIYFGTCHSNSDIFIYIPQLKMLFTGDLFFKYGRPSIADKSMLDKEKWERAIKWIEKRISNIESIISGHGELLSIEDLKDFNLNMIEKCTNRSTD